ncbi:hypothetical protein JHN49_01805 [Streptomyces sp. MBT57]|nr:hypothetical protein [Streptomyces sp. MBT57]
MTVKLRSAAQILLDLADETDDEIKANAYWHSEIAPEPVWPRTASTTQSVALVVGSRGSCPRMLPAASPNGYGTKRSSARAWSRSTDT